MIKVYFKAHNLPKLSADSGTSALMDEALPKEALFVNLTSRR